MILVSKGNELCFYHSRPIHTWLDVFNKQVGQVTGGAVWFPCARYTGDITSPPPPPQQRQTKYATNFLPKCCLCKTCFIGVGRSSVAVCHFPQPSKWFFLPLSCESWLIGFCRCVLQQLKLAVGSEDCCPNRVLMTGGGWLISFL